MSGRGTAFLAVAVWLPAVAALVVAVWGAVSADARMLRAETPLPLVWAGVGGILAVTAVAIQLGVRGRRRRDERIRRAVADSAAADHRRFLARLDHELKNPITAIRIAVAASETPSPALETIEAQTGRLVSLVSDLRKLSELQTVEIERSRVDVGGLVADVVSAVRDVYARDVAVTLPAAPWPLPAVVGDPDLLYVAVYNVVANSVKYSAAGDVIELRGHEEGGRVVLDVSDTGRGIPASDLDDVFDELARASNARDRPGSGLGLALVRTIVRRHGGAVTIASREGQGTRVRIELPAAG